MATKDRLKEFLAFKKIGRNKFEAKLGIANGYMSSKGFSITSDVIEKSAIEFPDLNIEWLITGKGEMLKNSGAVIGSNQGEGNKIEYRNAGNVEVGNNVNVTLPESGTQKIIKPDGTVELTSVDSNNLELENIKRENEELKLKISHLKDNMSVKDELIASLKETIELLKHKQ